MQRFVLPRIDNALDGVQILDQHAFPPTEQVEPPLEQTVVHILKAFDLGGYAVSTPLVRIAEPFSASREQIGTLGSKLLAQPFEHAHGRALRIGLAIQIVSDLEDDLLVAMQVPKAHTLFFLIGEVEAHLKTNQLPAPVDQPVVQQMAMVRQRVREFPHVAFLDAEQMIRAERTRLIATLQELVALDALQIGIERHLEKPAARLVHVQKLVRLDIRYVKRIGIVQIVVVFSHGEPSFTVTDMPAFALRGYWYCVLV